MTVYVVSKLSSPVSYNFYKEGEGIRIIEKSVRIKGGANVVNEKELFTPSGVVTAVSDEDFELLKNDRVFNIHLNNGFVKVIKSEPKDMDKAVSDLSKKDKSAPITPEEIDAEGGISDGEKVHKVKVKKGK